MTPAIGLISLVAKTFMMLLGLTAHIGLSKGLMRGQWFYHAFLDILCDGNMYVSPPL